MWEAEAHLAINHLPFAGVLFGVALLVYGMVRKEEVYIRTSFVFFLSAALITAPVYIFGEMAHDKVARLPGVSHPLIEAHEDAALLAAIVMGVLGLLMVDGHFRLGKRGKIPGWFSKATLAMAVASLLLLVNAQKHGGEIRHPELRANFQPRFPGVPGIPFGGHQHDHKDAGGHDHGAAHDHGKEHDHEGHKHQH